MRKQIELVAAIITIVGGALGVWEFAVRNGLLPAPGPINIVFPSERPVPPTIDPGITIPPLPTSHPLAAPVATISGDCSTGFTIRWTAVDGAESYRIEVDGHFRSTEQDTEFFFPAQELFGQQRYQVFAQVPPVHSDGSAMMTAGPC
jgi:hypothetical protein